MAGPVAPKDPEKRRPFFYIMRNKEIFGAKHPEGNGKGVQFIYENDGRLISSAKIAGNITDETMLNNLLTTEGFRKMIHSIGVSVETEDPAEELEFIFQMYGKTNMYGGCTNIRAALTGNGMEVRIHLAEVDWQEDDNIPGQIRFEFATPELLAKASVRLYLNDGYEAPEVVEENSVDFGSENYKTMIARSVMQQGNLTRVKRAIQKAQNGEDVTLAYIGGSITQGAGATPINTECYAYKSYKAFADAYGTGKNVHYVKAGVGGTPSELGMLRFERDILRDKKNLPDVVVVEFAVNDEGDETKGNCYESLARMILSQENAPAVILLFAVFANDWNLQERLSPVGKLYELPMVSTLNAVSPQFQNKDRVISKNQYFYDVFHPTNDGHTIMADGITLLFQQAAEDLKKNGIGEDNTTELLEQKPVLGSTFDKVKLLDKKEWTTRARLVSCGSFDKTDKELQCVEMDLDLTGSPEFPYNWMNDGKADKFQPFELQINCKSLLIITKDSGDQTAGKADVYVDGRKVLTADPHMNGWTHCNPQILFTDQPGDQSVQVRMAEGDEDKTFTILGFGYVE